MILLMFVFGVVLGLVFAYGGLVVYWRRAEVPGVHRMHDEGPRLLVGDGGLRAL